MKTPDLDLPAATKARDEAIKSVGDNADTEWVRMAEAVVRGYAERGEPFTSEQILKLIGYAPGDHRAMGNVMLRMARAGVIKPTGDFVRGHSVTRHGAPVRVWIGA